MEPTPIDTPLHSPRLDVVCRGDPQAMGVAQGEALRDKIHLAVRILAQLEAFRLQQPWWMPYPAYLWLAERKARHYTTALAGVFPEIGQRLRGLAEGARLGEPTMALFNVMEPLLSAVGGCTASAGACSAVAVRGRRSATGMPLIARNFDYLPLVQPLYMLRDSRPQNQARALEFTTAPLAGAVDGINEYGLAITNNYAFTTDLPVAPAAPISMIITEALQRCRTVTEAVTWIESRPRWGAGLLMLADATGDIASLEVSSTRSAVRRPAPGEDVLFHTNAFTMSQMLAVQVPQDAVYTDRAPAPMRGRRLHQSSERRDQRFRELLSGDRVLGSDDLARIMADHGSQGTPDDFTPCVHGSYWYTTACLQLSPTTRNLRIAYSTACQAQYVTFGL